MTLPGGGELIIILIIILVLFGGSKLSGLGKGMGDFIREFRSASGDEDDADAPVDSDA